MATCKCCNALRKQGQYQIISNTKGISLGIATTTVFPYFVAFTHNNRAVSSYISYCPFCGTPIEGFTKMVKDCVKSLETIQDSVEIDISNIKRIKHR